MHRLPQADHHLQKECAEGDAVQGLLQEGEQFAGVEFGPQEKTNQEGDCGGDRC
jgi:hypothetical protein